MVPWNYIVDETRSLHSWHYAGTVYQYVENILPSARVDLWDGVPPLILCESRSLAGVLRDIAKTYLSPHRRHERAGRGIPPHRRGTTYQGCRWSR